MSSPTCEPYVIKRKTLFGVSLKYKKTTSLKYKKQQPLTFSDVWTSLASHNVRRYEDCILFSYTRHLKISLVYWTPFQEVGAWMFSFSVITVLTITSDYREVEFIHRFQASTADTWKRQTDKCFTDLRKKVKLSIRTYWRMFLCTQLCLIKRKAKLDPGYG